jgi:hypothetical protein
MNKKSAPFDYAQGKHQHTSTLAPIRLRSGQALAHKKSSHFFTQKCPSPNRRIIKSPNQKQSLFCYSGTIISTPAPFDFAQGSASANQHIKNQLRC